MCTGHLNIIKCTILATIMVQFWQSIIKNDKELFKIHSIFGDNIMELELTIYKKNEVFKLHVNEKELQAQAKKCRFQFAEYLDTLKNNLKNISENVEMKIANEKFVVVLILENKMKLQYFQGHLEKVDFMENIFKPTDVFYENMAKITEEFECFKEKYDRIQKENIQLKNKLEEFVDRKNAEEGELFSKFVMLLNEKKRQIQHLNSLLIAFKKGRPVHNAPVDIPEKKTTKKSKKPNNSKVTNIKTETKFNSEDSNSTKYSSDENVNSDNETVSSIKKEKVEEPSYPQPSTSKSKFAFDDDLPSLAPSVKRICVAKVPDLSDCISIQTQEKKEKEQQHETEDTSQGNDKMTDSPTVDFNTQDLLDNIII